MQRAIAKALELQPAILQLVRGIQTGHGYLLECDPESSDLWCPCKAAEFTGTCYHRAAVGLTIGTVPQAWIPADASSMAVAS